MDNLQTCNRRGCGNVLNGDHYLTEDGFICPECNHEMKDVNTDDIHTFMTTEAHHEKSL